MDTPSNTTSSHQPTLSFETELAALRQSIISQLQFLVSSRQYTFWRMDHDSEQDEEESDEAFFSLPIAYISGNHGNINMYRLTRIFRSHAHVIHLDGMDDESRASISDIELHWLDTDTLSTLLAMIMKGEFLE